MLTQICGAEMQCSNSLVSYIETHAYPPEYIPERGKISDKERISTTKKGNEEFILLQAEQEINTRKNVKKIHHPQQEELEMFIEEGQIQHF